MVYAADSTSDPWEYLKFSLNFNTEDRPLMGIGEFLSVALNILLGTALAISMIATIMSGIKYITSGGDPKAKASAQQALIYSIVAFILTIGAFTIKTIIFNLLGGDYGEVRNATPSF